MQYCYNSQYTQRNILITICYDGGNYHGWQIQKNAITVQGTFQNAMKKIFGRTFDIKGCSRTDSGVHANMYCLNTKINSNISCIDLISAFNQALPVDIAVKDCKEVPLTFHARYFCLSKEYIYKIWNEKVRNPFLNGYAFHYRYPIDIDLISKASKFYTGRHDFSSFCNSNNKCIDTVRNVKRFEICKKDSIIEMKVEADGFLYNMVRIMVGTLLKICQGEIAANDIPYIIETKNRARAGPTAPACGLYLNKVFY